MSCCTSIRNIGCLQSCDLIQFGEVAPQTGDYIVEIQPENKRTYSTYNTSGNPLFLTNRLNEDGTTVFRVLLPDGNYFTDDEGYTCFKVTNSIAVDPTKADTTIDPVTCASATYQNSDASFTQSIASGATYTATDITVTEVDSSTTTVPANTDVTCDASLCPQTLTVYIYFQDGTDTIVANGIPGTISTESTSGGSTYTYNGDTFAAWSKTWGGDVTIVRSTTSGAETLTLTGTYT